MAETVIKPPQSIAVCGDDQGKRSVSAISIAISEPAASEIRYRVRIDCKFSGGLARLGQIRTTAPASAGIPSRIVAICCAPGVLAWIVRVTPIAPYSAADVGGTLKVDGWFESGTAPGITPMSGSLLEAGGPDAGIYNNASGTAPGVVTVPAGAPVDEISLIANTVGDATIAVVSPDLGALPVTTVKTGTGFTTKPTGLMGPATITFGGNVLEYFAAWREVL
jgi:hypothetical protein